MQTETITLTLTAGIAIFVFSTMLYNYLKKSQGQISTIEDTLGNVVNSTRSMYESVLSSNERANSMDILYQEGHRKMLNDHSTIVQQVPPTLTELQQSQETIVFDIERMQQHMEELQQNSVTKNESKEMASHLNAHRHQHQRHRRPAHGCQRPAARCERSGQPVQFPVGTDGLQHGRHCHRQRHGWLELAAIEREFRPDRQLGRL